MASVSRVFLVTATVISLAVVSAIQFTAPVYPVSEGRGFITVCLETNDSETENDTNTTVTFSTRSESADEGIDFMVLNLTTELEDSVSKCLEVNVTILDDAIFEDNETFIIMAEYVNSSNVTVHTSATINIIDDDFAEVSIRVAPERAVSENIGWFTLCARLDSPAGGLKDNLALSFNITNKTSQFEVNKTLATQTNSEECFNITLEDDDIFEDNSTVTVHLSSMLSRVIILNDTVHVIVIDDDHLQLQLGNDSSIQEVIEGGQAEICTKLILNRQIERNFSVNISTITEAGDTARENEDYTNAFKMLTFTPKTVANLSVHACINISITDDDDGEPLETFTVEVQSSDPRVSVNGSRSRITVTIRDNEIVTGIIPENFQVTDRQSRNFTLSWIHPPKTNVSITGYRLNCSILSVEVDRNSTTSIIEVDQNSTTSFEVDQNSTTAVVGGLIPFTNYSCYIYARVKGNRGELSAAVLNQTTEERPGSAPINISVSNKSSIHIEFTWSPPELTYGNIIFYNLSFNFTNGSSINNTTNKSYFSIFPLCPFQWVGVRIAATNSAGQGPYSDPPISVITDESKPGPISNLIVRATNSSTLNVLWSTPEMPNGRIRSYTVAVCRVNKNCSDTVNFKCNTTTGPMLGHNVTHLESMTPFRIFVSATNSAGTSDNRSVCSFTHQGVPMSPQNVTAHRVGDNSFTVQWKNLTLVQARGWLLKYTVHYWDQLKQNRSSALNFSTDGVKTTLNISKGVDVYTNYVIVVTAHTTVGEGNDSNQVFLAGRAPPDQSKSDVVIGSVVSVLLVIILAIAGSIISLLFLFRRRIFRGRSATLSMKRFSTPNSIRLNAYTNHSNSSSESEASTDIPVFEFANYVKKMHKDSNHLFEQQYRSIRDPDHRHTVAFLPCNVDTKNRFIDIFPYDANRVILKNTGAEGSDYINASWINGYKRKREYIAAQGPKEETLEDFWRMISENQLTTIVMVTRTIEGLKKVEKCKQYWPTQVGHTLKFNRTNMMVTLTETKQFADYQINTLILKKAHCEDLNITHFYYEGWPDHGVPQYATSLLGFLHHVRRKHRYFDSSPLLVHCSAGVGRTGTFITLDVMLQKIKEEQTVNVYEFVKQLRKSRCQMVQTESQYIFIHDALNEYITSGDTEIVVGNLRIALNKLYQNDSLGFRRQFKLLSKVSRRPNQVDIDTANTELHQYKNRYPERIPYKDMGVKLKPSGVVGGEYINASFINGYKCVNGFIAAQAPLKNTVEAFWRMIWEIKCQTIVLLCDVERETTGQETYLVDVSIGCSNPPQFLILRRIGASNQNSSCVRFWPTSGSETYNKLRVTFMSERERNDIITRKLDISFDKQRTSVTNGEKMSVTLFHHKEWNESGEQPLSRSILQLNTDIIRSQISTGNKPILVTCNDGCGRTGAFLTIYSQIERLKTEQVIDVFQWVKSARIQRSGLVGNQEQYELIYEVIADFLDSFDTYANFQVVEDEL